MIFKSGKGRTAKYFYTNSETKEQIEIDVFTYYTIRNFLKRVEQDEEATN
jgi:hypothetical protein